MQIGFFIETDPIQIPKMFEEKEDIEISGFLAASLAWGQRPTIIRKCRELMQLLDYAPYDFILNATETDYERFTHFKHRTFNAYDCCYFYMHWPISTGIWEGWKKYLPIRSVNTATC